MIIGVPKEIKLQEHRIGLTPESVKALSERNHDVLVENNGGFEAGFTNDDYLKAKITKLENEMLIIKKTIQQDDIRKQEILFLELNLLYEKKCKKTFYNKLYVKGSEDYKNCILSKGVVKKN